MLHHSLTVRAASCPFRVSLVASSASASSFVSDQSPTERFTSPFASHLWTYYCCRGRRDASHKPISKCRCHPLPYRDDSAIYPSEARLPLQAQCPPGRRCRSQLSARRAPPLELAVSSIERCVAQKSQVRHRAMDSAWTVAATTYSCARRFRGR